MELLKLTLLSIALVSIAAADDFKILESTKTSYKFIEKEFFMWSELRCQANGAKLWIPRSDREISDVLALFKSEQFEHIWIGIYKQRNVEMGDLYGKTDFYSNWAGDNHTKHSDVAVKMKKDGTYSFEYMLREYSAICEKKNRNSFDSNTSDGYTHIPNQRASYKLYADSLTAASANLKCLRDNADLWVPESKEEINAVYKAIISNKYNQILIGIHSFFNDEFISIDGRKNYYSEWVKGHPKRLHYTTTITRAGSYTTALIEPDGFVCKRNKN